MVITEKDREIPSHIVEKWQDMVDLLVENNKTPDVLITRVNYPYLEIFNASQNKENTFAEGHKVKLAGHFCQHVISTKNKLEVNNAIKDENWQNAPEVEDDLIAYIGYPLQWPDGKVFGTLCSHDYQERKFTDNLKKNMKQAKELIESHLKIIYKNHKLTKSKNRYHKLFEISPTALLLQDSRGKILEVNKALTKLTGYSKKELEGSNIFDMLVPPKDHKEAKENIKKILQGKNLESEKKTYDKNGNCHYVKLRESCIELENEKKGILTMYSDITKEKKSQKKVNELLEKRRILLDNIEIQVWFLKDLEMYGIVNQAHADFFGKEKSELENKSIWEIMSTKEEALTCIDGNKEVFEKKKKIHREEKAKNAEGESRLLSVTKTPKLNKNGEVEYVVCSAIDITEQRQKENKIKYISYHDKLTGLYNRSYLEEEIKRLDVDRKLPISVIMADLNGLKLVNDSYGHKEGDKLLVSAADILKECCRKEDIVGRWGGDEFLIFLPKTNQKAAKKIANRIKNKSNKIEINNKKKGPIPLSMALGFAVKNDKKKDIHEILNKAEDIMYKNKLIESRSVKGHILDTLINTLSEKSQETKEHSTRMKNLALQLGKKILLNSAQLDKLALMTKLHDIGKVIIPEKILNKKEDLTKKEWNKIKEHPATGHRITSSTEEFSHVSKGILAHHEHWDGSGYPRGLKEEKIPLLARIIAIVDAYDVMTHDRPYQKTKSKKEAIEELKRCSGTQFDPELVEKFIEIIE
ncbi:MAG TPA: HD domain-containing phosphohydrolase [Halanaerobiales bacterium]|mgnify:FL=1|nr:HD domain-containing phosphohydrolase [Halanaerobiales bacterium]